LGTPNNALNAHMAELRTIHVLLRTDQLTKYTTIYNNIALFISWDNPQTYDKNLNGPEAKTITATSIKCWC